MARMKREEAILLIVARSMAEERMCRVERVYGRAREREEDQRGGGRRLHPKKMTVR